MTEPVREQESGPETTDVVEIALREQRDDTAEDSPSRRVLIKHERLIDAQIVREAEALKLARLTRLRERIKAGRDLSLVGLVLLVLGGLGGLVWSARQAQGLVVEPISAPPDFVARGITDQVLAARFLDKLTAIQQGAGSIRSQGTFRSGWGDDVRVALPEVGISLADTHRWLRRTLGKETYVGGEVVRTPQGVTMTARTGTTPGVSAQGRESEVDALLERTAEALHKQIQPLQHASYLTNRGRLDEALKLSEQLAGAGPDTERAWAYTLVTHVLFQQGDEPGAGAAARAAVRLQPGSPLAREALSYAEHRLGHDEAALRHRRATLDGEARSLTEVTPKLRQRFVLTGRRVVAELTGDYAGAAAELAEDRASDATTLRADMLARNHDVSGATGLLERPAAKTDAERLAYAPGGDVMLPDYERLAALDRWPEALDAIRATEAGAVALPKGAQPLLDEVRSRFLRPRLAYALARTGQHAEAEAVAAATPTDCYACLVVRGQAAALRGDARGSDRWFAEAVRQGPSLPFAYAEWGEAKLARGDDNGALNLFRAARERGPRWADPLKLEGDLLARRGDHREAVRRYAQAAERAPRWGGLHLAWGRALDALGRRDEARAKYAQATRLDLNAADRAATARRP